MQVARAREQDRVWNGNKKYEIEIVDEEDAPTPPGLKPGKRHPNKSTAKRAPNVSNRQKSKRFKPEHPGDQDAQGSLSKIRTYTRRMQKLRQKQISREQAEVKEADRVARSKKRNKQTSKEVEESKEQDRA